MYTFTKIKTNKEGVEKLANDMFEEYKYCFCKDSTEKWIKMFAEKRFERIRDEQEERFDTKLSKSFEKKVIARFTELIQEYVNGRKKAFRAEQRRKDAEEKEYIRKHGVKRGKVD